MSNEETKRKLLQKDSFRLAKGLVLLSKRTPFGIQKDSFWNTKGLVLKRKRTTFAPLLQIHALFARKYLPKQSFLIRFAETKRTPTHQIVLCTQKAIECIRYTSHYLL